MFKSYITIAWRYLRKDRPFTILNLVGLSTGLACTLLIYLWVTDELAMDHMHEKDSQLYQVMDNRHDKDGIRTMDATPALLARTLKEEMPEVEYAAGVLATSWYGKVTLSARQMTLSAKQEDIKAVGHYADKDFFNVFSYPLLQGNRDGVLADKKSIVLSRELALKLFHTTENVIGKTVEWEHEQPYVVSGIFEGDLPHSSDQFDFVLPMELFLDTHPWEKVWGRSEDPSTYVVLKQGANRAAFDRKIADLIKHKSQNTDVNLTLSTRLYSSGYLYGQYENGVQAGGRIEYVRLFSLIALFILVIACINFMNLSTAKASKRMKEVGVKKCIGASRMALIFQFLGESLVMTCLSLVLAVLLVKLLLPAFNSITGKQLSLLPDNQFVGVLLAVTLVTGLLAGSYPALYLSSFRPAVVLKGGLKTSMGELWVRKGLVVFQFTLTVLFIIAVLVVYKQIQYIQRKDPGFKRDHILSFDLPAMHEKATETLLADIRNVPGVINASGMDHRSLIGDFGGSVPYWEGMNPKEYFNINNIGINYGMIETLGLEVVKGRTFSRTLSSDTGEVILNQAAVDKMGIKNPIGMKLGIFQGDGMRTVVGVVKDFHFESMHKVVGPFALRLVSQYTRDMMVKIRAGSEQNAIGQVQQLYAKAAPGVPFEYRFLDDDFQAQYVAEKRVAILSEYFGALAILISCLGLYGLAAFTAERRFKEIGIRKVLGASVRGVVLLLSADFLKLVLIAVLIAFPLAWWVSNQWLSGFAYRTSIGVGVFLLAGATTLLITIATISFQAIRAAMANPVKSLKSE
ncbi:MAG TPA: ABC transporter permease [Puia sp.]|nr:ABC transporter permease [Puia sp.]